jgi:hypothetical protein
MQAISHCIRFQKCKLNSLKASFHLFQISHYTLEQGILQPTLAFFQARERNRRARFFRGHNSFPVQLIQPQPFAQLLLRQHTSAAEESSSNKQCFPLLV